MVLQAGVAENSTDLILGDTTKMPNRRDGEIIVGIREPELIRKSIRDDSWDSFRTDSVTQ
jgi:hypothetical protein